MEPELGSFDAWFEFPFSGKILAVFAKVGVHVALGRFHRIEWNRNTGKPVIEIICHLDMVASLRDGPEIGFDQFSISCVGLIGR